jgi:anthranilate phosphoribosyltransferase
MSAPGSQPLADSSAAQQAAIYAALAELAAGRSLSEAQASDLFRRLLTGEMDPAQVGAMLALLQVRLPTVDEVTGAARVMREHVTPLPLPVGVAPEGVLDTCGTGGTAKFLNVSTLAAIVTASAGGGKVHVAKHGNRSRSGRGSAEILSELGVHVDADATTQARCLQEVRISFSFAIHHHPAMKFAGPARRAVGFPTIFNLLGPLTNPAGARRQLIGVYRPELVSVVAGALARLGVTRALVVYGEAGDGTGCDELTIMGRTVGAVVEDGAVRGWDTEPEAAGVNRGDVRHYAALDLAGATALARQVLGGIESPAAEMVILNAGAALWVGGAAESIRAGTEAARQAIADGRAQRTLDAWSRISRG